MNNNLLQTKPTVRNFLIVAAAQVIDFSFNYPEFPDSCIQIFEAGENEE